MDTKIVKAKNKESGVLSALLSAAETTTAYMSPVPANAPGIVVFEPGTAKEEHVYYKTRDAGAGTIGGLTRDYTSLNGGSGQEHTNGEDWETLQAVEYLNNIVDAIQESMQEEMQTCTYVSGTSFTVATNRTAIYTVGRIIRFDQSTSLIGVVTSSSYSAGTGLTTVNVAVATVPNPIVHVEFSLQPKGLTATQYLTTISEIVSGAGVTIDSLLIKDGYIQTADGAVIMDANGNEILKILKVASAVNEITLSNAATGGSPLIQPTGGDTNIGLDIKTKGTGKLRKPTVLEVAVVAPGTDVAIGDGKAMFEVPEELNGMDLIGCGAFVYTAGTTGTMDIQIRNVTQAADMLTTKITIDSTETSSRTAATAPVIDTANDDVATGDIIAIDVDAVQTTKAKGLSVWLRFALP